ncbi:MAG: class I SAM-dependent methyltransferase [Chloroflexota bacterium]|nr:class I SAM-dependent methyltransferase [Chloroflexota bacterium]
MDPKDLVAQGYDRIAESYLASKDPDDPIMLAALERLTAGLPDGAAVLDLGCGAGVPATRRLAERFAVTGVDLSARQIALARQQVPGATFQQADMTQIDFPAGSLAAVVSFYAIIHVPRSEQPGLLARIAGWLQPGGRFFATWAVSDWEGSDPDWEGWGAPMWWSHYDGDTNLALLQSAGFTIDWAERITQHGETWLWVLAHVA